MKLWIKRGLILSLIVYLSFIVLLNLAGSQVAKGMPEQTGSSQGLSTLAAIFPLFPYFDTGTFTLVITIGFILSLLTSYIKYIIENIKIWNDLTMQGKIFTIILIVLNFILVYFLFWYVLKWGFIKF